MAASFTRTVVAIFSAYLCYVSYMVYGFFAPKSAPPGSVQCYQNSFETDPVPLDLRVFVSTDSKPKQKYHTEPVWEELNFSYTRETMDRRNVTVNISIPANVQNGRASLYAHAVVTPSKSRGARSGSSSGSWKLQVLSQITRSLPIPPPSMKHNLLYEEKPQHSATSLDIAGKTRLHWVPGVRVQLVWDFTRFPADAIPSDVARHFSFQSRSGGGRPGQYVPALHIDQFHIRNDHIVDLPINTSTSTMPLELSLGPVSLGWWRMYANLEDSMGMMHEKFGADEKDTDDMRRMFTETTPVLLGVTMLVSLLHMLFEILALKNDVAFWRARNTPEGLSLRGIVFSAACQVVVLLYLIENNSSFLVRVSVVAGLFIELWKIVRLWGMNPEGGASEAAKSTAKADEQIGRLMGIVFAPCVLAYAAYSLLYETHSGWYGWIISSLYGLVFTLGFVAMTPQLFINYRLKSIEHMPWRTLVYRALNTFIDDLFAFIITMPTMHRLSAFRDDIVFFIFLYQKWIYPIDHSRSTEAEGSPLDPRNLEKVETVAERTCVEPAQVTPARQSTRKKTKKKTN